jgi:ComF family protein
MKSEVYQTIRRLTSEALISIESLFPKSCLICEECARESKLSICQHCLNKLPRLEQTPNDLAQHTEWGPLFIPFLYRGAVPTLIQKLKYRDQLHISKLLSDLLQLELQRESLHSQITDPPDFILPVPLHPQRLRQRGFNQAVEIIRAPAKRLNIPLELNLCRRRLNTSAQAGLNAKTRKKNLQSAFEVTGDLSSANIALFDDVITTGSTMDALVKVLKEAGANEIQIWAVAYTPPR